jgi:23S rRNA pseudouridine1911/1915/1917 synthase
MINQTKQYTLAATVTDEQAGKRFDQALAILFPEHSRSRLKKWIDKNQVMVNGGFRRPRDRVEIGDVVSIDAEEAIVADWGAEALPLEIVHEDDDILVINKSANWVTHPGAGNWSGTVVNALLHYCPALENIPRAGIVHRLDKDTTGILIVAKTLEAQTQLVQQLQSRSVKRSYEAVVCGMVLSGGTIDAPIGRHPQERTKMAVVESGKTAVTHYRVLKKFMAHTHLKVELETGRTHQIRVHLSHIHYPIVGDKVYGGRLRLPPNSTEALRQMLQTFPRQALHAKALALTHPISGTAVGWEVPIPADMQALLAALEKG